MLTQELKSKALVLRAEIATKEGRAAVVELKAEVQQSGATARELASVLGVHESTLCRWGREVGVRGRRGRRSSVARPDQAESKFRLVAVAAETASTSRALFSGPPRQSLRAVHAPSGLVIEGLDVETVAALLQRMSCCSGR
jgi:transposase-like protein